MTSRPARGRDTASAGVIAVLREEDWPRIGVQLDHLLDRAVAGVPPWRRPHTRRELAGYLEDAFVDLLGDGVSPDGAIAMLREQFGDPETVAAGFRALPAPRWARGARRAGSPLGAVMLGLVIGLALVHARTPAGGGSAADDAALGQVDGLQSSSRLAALHVREVSTLQLPNNETGGRAPLSYGVAARFGANSGSQELVLEPSVPALTPAWLPPGYDPEQAALFLTASGTTQFFADERGARAGIIVEVLRADRSTVFQIKERHVFPMQVGDAPGFYIDGEWEVRGPTDEQPAPASWRTDRSRTLLFARDDLLVLVAGPADVAEPESLLRIARSLR